jgi:plasmid stabilization system protein ParE
MAFIRFTPAALEDLERLVEFLREQDTEGAAATAPLIFKGIGLLQEHPLVGRPIDDFRRELVIHRGRSGYLAQYHFDAKRDEIVILALRHQRELGE